MKYKEINKDLKIPAIGQGTAGLEDYLSKNLKDKIIKSLRFGIDLGMNFIDTAEIYGSGQCEEIVGETIKGIRNKVFIATKFSPEHNSYSDILKAAEGSLKRLKTDYIDLYQIHWPNPKIPIKETMQAMEKLVEQGKIRHIGVSNFYLGQLKEAQESLIDNRIFSLQVEYNLFDRSIENNVLPYCEKEKIAIIAYSPLNQGRTISNEKNKLERLEKITRKYRKTHSQIALNWLINHQNVIAIPKSINEKHIIENASSADFKLSKEDFNEISKLYDEKPIFVEIDKINVSAKGQNNRKVYQTLKQAFDNKLNFVPSPADLGQYIQDHQEEDIKPVRLILNEKGGFNRNSEYSLVEGRGRYWAWVIAHKCKISIP